MAVAVSAGNRGCAVAALKSRRTERRGLKADNDAARAVAVFAGICESVAGAAGDRSCRFCRSTQFNTEAKEEGGGIAVFAANRESCKGGCRFCRNSGMRVFRRRLPFLPRLHMWCAPPMKGVYRRGVKESVACESGRRDGQGRSKTVKCGREF